MKLLIAGSRGISNYDLSKHIPSNVGLIISGGANGIDSCAEEYADKHGISKLILRPSYSLYGRAAPIRRNEKMVGYADAALIIWDGKSRGTKSTIDYVKKAKIPMTLVLAVAGGEEKIVYFCK